MKIPLISRWWRSSRLWALTLVLGILFILCFGSFLGITQVYTDHETGRQFTGLNSAAALSGYFALIFGLANWPFETTTSNQALHQWRPASLIGKSGAMAGPPSVSLSVSRLPSL